MVTIPSFSSTEHLFLTIDLNKTYAFGNLFWGSYKDMVHWGKKKMHLSNWETLLDSVTLKEKVAIKYIISKNSFYVFRRLCNFRHETFINIKVLIIFSFV